jgi:hypothetical protein
MVLGAQLMVILDATVVLVAPLFIAETARQPGRFDVTGALTSITGVASLAHAFTLSTIFDVCALLVVLAGLSRRTSTPRGHHAQ